METIKTYTFEVEFSAVWLIVVPVLAVIAYFVI